MRDTAIVLIGPRACGKSTVGREIARRRSWPYLSFGTHVRKLASSRGVSKLLLEQFGNELIETMGHDGLLAEVLMSTAEDTTNVILDGVRHIDMLVTVKTAYRHVRSYYLEASENTRYRRWLSREAAADSPTSLETFRGYSAAPVERHVFSLADHVDCVLTADQPLDLIVRQIEQGM